MKHFLWIAAIVSCVFSNESTEQKLSGEWIYIKSIPAKSDSSTSRVESIKEKHLIEFIITENKKEINMCHTGKHTSPNKCKKDWYKLKVEKDQISLHRGDNLDFSLFIRLEFQGDTLALETWRAYGTPIYPSVMDKDLYIRSSNSDDN